ncbi:MAG: BMP family ABC transporter substrate-binding protein [Clostridia bacterium]
MVTVSAVAEGVPADKIKVGFIYIGDENEGYTYSHYKGALEMKKTFGLTDEQIIVKWLVPESEACYEAAVDLAEQGCNIIFANSFGMESYLFQAAKEYPNIQFCHATGTQALASELTNVHNYFTAIYEARYVSGVVAGLKLSQMIADGKIKAEEAKIGYVGAYPFAEVVSGYTSFFLGARSVCPSATMQVTYTNSWASADLEKAAAEALIADKCVLISQHADTTGASTACEAAGVPIVGYNISMIPTAPTQALTSPTNNWAPYVTFAVKNVIEGTEIPRDWCKGFADDAVTVTELNEKAIAPGTAEKVAQVEQDIKDGKLHVFDCASFTVGGETVTTFDTAFGFEGNQLVADGYFHESELRSAPCFELRIDGITEK